MDSQPSRRDWLKGAAMLGAASLGPSALVAAPPRSPRDSFTFCFNTSTIRGQKRPLPEVVDIVAKAGYQAIEPWINEIDRYVQEGGNLKDLAKRIRDHGLTVEDAIGFPTWVVDDDAKRKQGLEEARRCMDLVLQLGGKRLAAPPAGATDQANLNLLKAAERYRALLEVGDKMGVVPQVEVWGFSKALGRLGETALVAVESGHPRACILPDVYHLYKGGSDFLGLHLLSPDAIQIFHLNDYPKNPTRAKIADRDRVYPGDGIAPWKTIFQGLRAAGFHGVLSLELFNPEYYKQDPLEVAKTGLAKMKHVVQTSLE